MKLIVGIDFGTSTTVVRFKEEGADSVKPIKDSDRVHDIIPSAIFRIKGQQSLYGYEALNAKSSNIEGELITNFKMGLLDEDKDSLSFKKQCIQEFLSYVHRCFSKQTDGMLYDAMEVYISYPVKWTDSFVDFMKTAVANAGFNGKIYGMSEPKAATYNMLHGHLHHFKAAQMLTSRKPMYVFMLDMGAGTTDIIIFRLKIDSNNQVEIDKMLAYPYVNNPYLCGGREIDELLSAYVCDFIKKKTGMADLDEEFFAIDSAKKWKDGPVSNQLKNNLSLNVPQELVQVLKLMPNGRNVSQSFMLTRNIFENITVGHWDNLYKLITSAMQEYKREYNIGAEDIDLLYLTGGHSQWYTVRNLFNGEGVNGYIGKDIRMANQNIPALNFKKLKEESWRMFEDSLPHECVATGLCLQNKQFKMIDVSANNIWMSISINGKQTDFMVDGKSEQYIQIAKIGEKLPINKNVAPQVTLHTDAGEKQIFDVSIELRTGLTLDDARKGILKQKINNDAGRLFVNILFLGLPYLFGGYDTTIKIPTEVIVNNDNSINIDGCYLVCNGTSTPTDKDILKDKNGEEVKLSKIEFQYE